MNRPSRTASERGEAAAFGSPMPSVKWPRMRLISWKPLVRGSLRGFATVELPIGLKIFDCPILTGPNGPRAFETANRQGPAEDRVNGKAAFAPVCEWRDRSLSDGFSAAVVALARTEHPADLEEGEVR